MSLLSYIRFPPRSPEGNLARLCYRRCLYTRKNFPSTPLAVTLLCRSNKPPPFHFKLRSLGCHAGNCGNRPPASPWADKYLKWKMLLAYCRQVTFYDYSPVGANNFPKKLQNARRVPPHRVQDLVSWSTLLGAIGQPSRRFY